MKKIFIAAIFLTMSFACLAQITYEATYNTHMPVIGYFKYISPKWITINVINNEIKLYHLNHSLYNQITIPQQDSTYGVYFITDGLFDNDSTNIEYLLFSILGPKYVRIYREDTTLLFARDSAGMAYWAITTNNYVKSFVMATDSGTKLVLPSLSSSSNVQYEIYSLPGSLPCFNPCDENFVGIREPFSNNYHLNNPYPNPSSSQTYIPIEFPQGINEGEIVLYDLNGNEVKRYKVDRTFSHLILSTAELAAGSYYYQMQTAKANSSGKKLIVIK